MAPQAVKIDEIKGLWSYLCSIDWTEPWLWALITFHVGCLFLTGATLKHFNVQIAIFLVYLLLVRCAEYMNEWAAKNWKLFAGQQYFDSQGLFISLVFSAPLLLNCFIIVVNWLYSSWNLLVSVKKAKLKQVEKAKKKAEEDKKK